MPKHILSPKALRVRKEIREIKNESQGFAGDGGYCVQSLIRVCHDSLGQLQKLYPLVLVQKGEKVEFPCEISYLYYSCADDGIPF